ncbi:MAG: hypothetical protein MOGMAGMI_00319 [Candidatus Omnitrophica bacterium]|nr:hypothetical protein [Candidatus Omnitrophota bacterium]
MNIFKTHECPIKCAMFLDDKRVIKMVLETAQLLCSSVYIHLFKNKYPNFTKQTRISYRAETDLYLPSHLNHPISAWVRLTRGNYIWTLEHFEALLEEYKFRFGREHKSSFLLPLLDIYIKYIPVGVQTKFPNCAINKSLGIDYSQVTPVTTAYRNYLTKRFEGDKRTPKWTNRGLTFIKEQGIINLSK